MDSNTANFHAQMKDRQARNRIVCVKNNHGILQTDDDSIAVAFVDFSRSCLNLLLKLGSLITKIQSLEPL